MAVYQLIFRECWPLGQEIRRPGEIVLEGECRIPNATPDKIAKAIVFGAIEIRTVEDKKSQFDGRNGNGYQPVKDNPAAASPARPKPPRKR